jgi:hypothetical protein
LKPPQKDFRCTFAASISSILSSIFTYIFSDDNSIICQYRLPAQFREVKTFIEKSDAIKKSTDEKSVLQLPE